MVAFLRYILPAISITFLVYSQSSEIKEKENELSTIKTEINKLEDDLVKKSSAEKKSFEAVENLSKQTYLLNKVIGSVRNDVRLKEDEIKRTESRIKVLGDEIKVLKDNYAAYVVAIYKKGAYNELEAIFDASSLQQAVLRIHYLQEFAENRQADLQKLQSKKAELTETKNTLIAEKKEKSELVSLKESENAELQKKLKDRKKILVSLQNDNRSLKKLIAAKKESQKIIESMILQMVEAEKKRKEEIVNEKPDNVDKSDIKTGGQTGSVDYDFITSTFSSFSELKGKMTWPLHKGKLMRKFGENKNKKLNTITLNYGIDIKASTDTRVRSVAEGIVSAIDWLPGYGNVLIVSHKENFRTVYGHLSEIFVSEGDKVKPGTVLALLDESIEGEILHFEIWQSREKQNPELWLAK
ncbi:MAG: peptidoglycan DD-metalloendopeptidase family protein [Ignavibacteriaceae bacterium]|nr:peptidoglycan DD-metalloendopeptidase family protein [Ignavibacteriaceae bacterium]